MALAPDDEAKRHGVVEQAHREERAPGVAAAGHPHAQRLYKRVEDYGGEANAE